MAMANHLRLARQSVPAWRCGQASLWHCCGQSHTDPKSAPVSNGLSDLGYLGPDGGTAVETVFRSFKLLIGALILLPILWMASCSMLFGGAAYAVKEAAGPVADAARREARRDAVRRHNEDTNRRAGFGPPREYDNDY